MHSWNSLCVQGDRKHRINSNRPTLKIAHVVAFNVRGNLNSPTGFSFILAPTMKEPLSVLVIFQDSASSRKLAPSPWTQDQFLIEFQEMMDVVLYSKSIC